MEWCLVWHALQSCLWSWCRVLMLHVNREVRSTRQAIGCALRAREIPCVNGRAYFTPSKCLRLHFPSQCKNVEDEPFCLRCVIVDLACTVEFQSSDMCLLPNLFLYSAVTANHTPASDCSSRNVRAAYCSPAEYVTL